MLQKYGPRIRGGLPLALKVSLLVFAFSTPVLVMAIWHAHSVYAWLAAVVSAAWTSCGFGLLLLFAAMLDVHPSEFQNREAYEAWVDQHRYDPPNWPKALTAMLLLALGWATWTYVTEATPLLRVGGNVLNASAASLFGR